MSESSKDRIVSVPASGAGPKRGPGTMAEMIVASGAVPIDDVSVLRPSTTPLSDEERVALAEFLAEE